MLIDTAGRYTTQDSNSKADKDSWLAFLDILKKSRSRQPINGVLVAISIEDILTLPKQELALHADAIRMRLLELHQRLKVSFPVYALFTKADLVAGFTEYFAYLARPAAARSGVPRSRPQTRPRIWWGRSRSSSTVCWSA